MPLSLFINRVAELDTLQRLHQRDARRLITVIGTGGVGKTRLVREYRRGVASDHPGIFIDLTSCTSTKTLLQTVTIALDTQVSLGAASNAIGETLRQKGLFTLFLDNCEQLQPDATTHIQAWLDTAWSLRVIATSRRRLNIPGEQLLEIKPLPTFDPLEDHTSEAASMFIACVQSYRPTYEPHTDRDLIKQIVTQLEGLPLAVELAAARTRLMSLPALLKRLAESNFMLTNPLDDTIHNTLQLSWDLLDEPEQNLLSALAVCTEPFDLETAQAVAPEPDKAPELLLKLLDNSLLHSDDIGTFNLFLFVRQFALSTSTPEQHHQAILRHATWFAQLARHILDTTPKFSTPELTTTQIKESIVAMTRASTSDDPDLVQLGLDLAQLFNSAKTQIILRTHSAALIATLILQAERVLEPDAAQLKDGHLLLAHLQSQAGQPDKAQNALRRAEELSAGDEEALGRVAYEQAYLHLTRGQNQKREEALQKALHIFSRTNNPLGKARCWIMEGIATIYKGDWDRAYTLLNDARDIALPKAATQLVSNIDINLAMLCYEQGRFTEARTRYRALLTRYDKTSGRIWSVFALMGLASAAMTTDHTDVACAWFTEALEAAQRTGARLAQQYMHRALASLALRKGNTELAHTYIQGALALAEKLGNKPLKNASLLDLTLIQWADDHYQTALQTLEKIDTHPEPRTRPSITAYKAAITARLGHLQTAQDLIEQAQTHEDDTGELRRIMFGLLRSFVWAAQNNLDAIAEALKPFMTPPQPSIVGISQRNIEAQLLASALWDVLGPHAFDVWCAARPDGVMLVSTDGQHLCLPSGETKRLDNLALLAVLMRSFVKAQTTDPPVGLSVDDLRAHLWPDEEMVPESAKNRVKQALNRLRRLGLKPYLNFEDGRYTLTGVPIHVVPEGFWLRG